MTDLVPTPSGNAQLRAVAIPVTLTEPAAQADGPVLSPAALQFVAELERRFGPRIDALLEARREVQARLDAGIHPNFLPETVEIRETSWTVAPIPEPLRDRRVEITGPVDAKSVINALNSGACCYMADFEDATAPTWRNVVEGQANLREAVRETLVFEDTER
ncbi:MAG: hypothetical protein AAFZ65_05500, partial [Planctomycetota bacterium]